MSIYFVYLTSFLMGIFGGYTSVLTGVLAFIGAVSEKEQRTARFSVLLSMSLIAGKTNLKAS